MHIHTEEDREQEVSVGSLNIWRFGGGVFRNSLYYSCSISANLKLFQNKLEKTVLFKMF